MKQQPVI